MNNNFELITLDVSARGEVISSNLDEFRDKVRYALSHVNRVLESDDDFDQAEIDVKGLKNAEAVVKAAKEKALKDAEGLHALFSALDDATKEVADARLELEKQIKARREQVRADIMAEARARFICVDRLKNVADAGMLESEIKGKRSPKSMRLAMDKAVALINRKINDSRYVIDSFIDKYGRDLVMDAEDLEIRSLEFVEGELRRRLEAHTAEQERKRLAEEAAKAQEEARKAKIDLEEVGKPPLPSMPADRFSSPECGSFGSPMDESVPLSEEAEWRIFQEQVIEAFEPLKQARESLKHSVNQEKAALFALAVNRAWVSIHNKEGVK